VWAVFPSIWYAPGAAALEFDQVEFRYAGDLARSQLLFGGWAHRISIADSTMIELPGTESWGFGGSTRESELNANDVAVDSSDFVNTQVTVAGDATFDDVAFSNVETALVVPAGTVSFRGSMENVTNGISACPMRLKDLGQCFVEAAHSYWGSDSGPAPYGSGARVCGAATAVPFRLADGSEAISPSQVFGPINNCDGSSFWDDLTESSIATNLRLTQLEADAAEGPCDPELGVDVCQVFALYLNCLGAAQSLATSQLGVSLPIDPGVGTVVDFGQTLMQAGADVTKGITSAGFTDRAAALGAASGVLGAIGTFQSMHEAYSQCG
jgi:hypothetical protein